MARIYMTGFEQGHISPLTDLTGAAVSVAEVRTGDYSMKLTGGDAEAKSPVFISSADEIYGRIALYYTGGSGNEARCILDFLDSAGGAQCGFGLLTADHRLVVRRGSMNGGTTLATSTDPVPQNEWICFEFHILVDNAAGVFQVKQNGVTIINFTGGDTQATANADIYQCWFSRQWRHIEGYMDDIAINDTTGTENFGWVGRGGIYGLFPNGAGTHTDFTPSAGANYACVDEVPPDDDTTYVESDTVNHQDTYAMANLPVGAGAIAAVQWIARAKLAAAGAGDFQRLLYHDAADYNGGNLAMDVSYKYFTEIFDQAPDATDWDVAKVNALEAGMEVV